MLSRQLFKVQLHSVLPIEISLNYLNLEINNRKKWHLLKNSLTVSRGVAPMQGKKKLWKSRWWPRNSCDGRLMAKTFNHNKNLSEFVPIPSKIGMGQHYQSELSLLKLSINLQALPFLDRHLKFHNFFALPIFAFRPPYRFFLRAWLFCVCYYHKSYLISNV